MTIEEGIRVALKAREDEITSLRAEVERLTNLHHTGVGYMKSADEALATLRAEVERKDAALRLWNLIDWDSMTEHDEALFDEAREQTRAALTPSQEKQNV